MKRQPLNFHACILMSTLLVFAFSAHADDAPAASSTIQASSPSVSDNMKAMDQDHDGIITTEEISHYLQSQRGRGYKQGVLDELERVANSRSCGSPFSRSVY
ncbi:MAG: hypothetical protein EBR31_04815 [Methylophilaceae bacterium]|nr:hypothetical protein [Methylophilaceae bacterium]